MLGLEAGGAGSAGGEVDAGEAALLVVVETPSTWLDIRWAKGEGVRPLSVNTGAERDRLVQRVTEADVDEPAPVWRGIAHEAGHGQAQVVAVRTRRLGQSAALDAGAMPCHVVTECR